MARKRKPTQTDEFEIHQLKQARAVARLIMMADELPHQMAEDMNDAASVVCDLLCEAHQHYSGQSEIEDAYALAGIITAANYGDDMRDDLARSAGVVSNLIEEAIEAIQKEAA